MKKLMFTAAAALCATVGFAIESANTVGYLQNELSATTVSGTIDVGVSFSNIGTQGGAYTVSNMLFNTQVADGDVILIFNPAAYNYDWYQYMSDTGSGNPGWMIQDMETFNITFVDSFTVNPGDSLVYMGASPDITISGEVADTKGASRVFTVDLSGDPDETMFPIANPFPVATTAKMFNGFVVDGDVLLVWNDSAYNYDWYQYMSDTGSGTPGWMVQDMETFDISFLTSEDDIILKVGTGAIFMPALGGTRTWTVSLSE